MTTTRCYSCCVLAVGLVLSQGCASTTATDAPPEKLAMNYFDSDVFDAKLGESMQRSTQEIIVEPAARISLNQIPERLDHWLVKARESDRKVDLKPTEAPDTPSDNASRGLPAMLIDIATGGYSAYQKIKANKTYQPAENYDVVIEYDKSTGDITSVKFLRTGD